MNTKLPKIDEAVTFLDNNNREDGSKAFLKKTEGRLFVLLVSTNNNYLIEIDEKSFILSEKDNGKIHLFCWNRSTANRWVHALSKTSLEKYEEVVNYFFQRFKELKLLEKGDLGNYKEGFCESITLKRSPHFAATRGIIGTYNPSNGKPIGYYQMLVSPKPELCRYQREYETFIDNSIFIFLINYFPQMLINGSQKEPIVFFQTDKDNSKRIRAMVFPPKCEDFYL